MGEAERPWQASSSMALEVRGAALAHLRVRWPRLDPADREDIAQETVLAVDAALAKGEPIHNPAAWATTTAFRKASNLARGRKRLLPPEEDELSPSAAVARFVAANVAVSAQAILREQAERLIAALDEDDLRLVWLLQEGELKQAEIAEVLGVSEAALKKRILRLRSRVRGEAAHLGLDDEPGEHPRLY